MWYIKRTLSLKKNGVKVAQSYEVFETIKEALEYAEEQRFYNIGTIYNISFSLKNFL